MEELTQREKEILNLLIDSHQKTKEENHSFCSGEVSEIKTQLLKEVGFSRYVKLMKEISFLLL